MSRCGCKGLGDSPRSHQAARLREVSAADNYSDQVRDGRGGRQRQREREGGCSQDPHRCVDVEAALKKALGVVVVVDLTSVRSRDHLQWPVFRRHVIAGRRTGTEETGCGVGGEKGDESCMDGSWVARLNVSLGRRFKMGGSDGHRYIAEDHAPSTDVAPLTLYTYGMQRSIGTFI